MIDLSTISMTIAPSGLADFFSSVIDAITTTDNPRVSTVTLPEIIEYVAIIAGALEGAMIACDRKLDIMGVSVLAMVTGLGGGLLRDMILPTSSVYMIDNPMTMVVCFVCALLVFFFRTLFTRMDSTLFLLDIVSVGLFTFVGADKALRAGYPFLSCVLMGVLTAVGGGMLRDICIREVPAIFKKGNFYAVTSLAGALVYMALVENYVIKGVAGVTCMVVTVALRFISAHYNLTTSTAVDLTPKVVRPLRAAWNSLTPVNSTIPRNSSGAVTRNTTRNTSNRAANPAPSKGAKTTDTGVVVTESSEKIPMQPEIRQVAGTVKPGVPLRRQQRQHGKPGGSPNAPKNENSDAPAR